MTNLLFPRLPLHVAMQLHEDFKGRSPEEIRPFAVVAHPRQIFTQTGGNRYPDDQLREIQISIQEIADRCGYPESSDQKARSRFDSETAVYLCQSLQVPLGELLREEMWMFMTAVMFPHIVKWRFPNFTVDRMKGGVRNVFQRLWERAYFLDRGEDNAERWKLVETLSEDAFVAILERPVLSADPVVARAIGEGWVRCAAKIGTGKMEDVHRAAVLQLRARFPVIAYAACNTETLEKAIDQEYDSAAGQPAKNNTIRNFFRRGT